ncbi:MAG: hypothetical protein RJA36_361 [Pseudomonadota bacterium]|jgi:hypothetical protein
MTMFKVEDLEAGPLLDQAVLLAMGAMRVLDPPEGVPPNVRERWPEGGALVLVDGGNMVFYGYGAAPPFSTDWGVGGPALIDKARMSLLFDGHDIWWAAKDGQKLAKSFISADDDDDEEVAAGQDGSETALSILCRAFVVSKVGPTIEVREPGWNVGTPTVTQGPPPLDQLEAALFTQAPDIGSTDCAHEVKYAGYRRVPMVADRNTNLTEIVFPASEQDDEVLVTHVAAIDGRGVIVAVHAL